MIVIIDYNLGNVNAFANIYKRFNVPFLITNNKNDIKIAEKLILPGVGSFDNAMNKFNNSGLREVVEKKVLEDKTPILGVCVGMQMLAKSSEEGKNNGLSWVDGVVKKFDISSISYKTKIPHMGWNSISFKNEISLFKGICNNSRFYFLHSYFFECLNNESIIASSNYGYHFTSAICSNNIYGVQFHPEKSHENGEKLLYNFANL